MKKYFFVIVITFLLSLTPLFGQMIITEEDAGLNNRAPADPSSVYVMVPIQNVNYDQWEYAPLGNCIWLLAGMGGAYLIQKRRRQK